MRKDQWGRFLGRKADKASYKDVRTTSKPWIAGGKYHKHSKSVRWYFLKQLQGWRSNSACWSFNFSERTSPHPSELNYTECDSHNRGRNHWRKLSQAQLVWALAVFEMDVRPVTGAGLEESVTSAKRGERATHTISVTRFASNSYSNWKKCAVNPRRGFARTSEMELTSRLEHILRVRQSHHEESAPSLGCSFFTSWNISLHQ